MANRVFATVPFPTITGSDSRYWWRQEELMKIDRFLFVCLEVLIWKFVASLHQLDVEGWGR